MRQKIYSGIQFLVPKCLMEEINRSFSSDWENDSIKDKCRYNILKDNIYSVDPNWEFDYDKSTKNLEIFYNAINTINDNDEFIIEIKIKRCKK